MISLRRLTKAYETPAGCFRALQSVDLEIGAGDFVAIIGKSGSGKSTLLNMVGGDRPAFIGRGERRQYGYFES
jgi:ABC-type lipoprotein export system ATPase subunit